MSWEPDQQPAPREKMKEELEEKSMVKKATHCGPGLMVNRKKHEGEIITLTSLVESYGWYPAMIDREDNNTVIMPLNRMGIGMDS